MSKNYLFQIKNQAELARKDFIKREIDALLLREIYNAYHQVRDIKTFIYRSMRVSPNLNCGIATVYLQHILKKGTIVNGYFKNEKHTFLSISDYGGPFIIDITADQFGGPAVYVGKLVYPWGEEAFYE